jgi:hypothetical protein
MSREYSPSHDFPARTAGAHRVLAVLTCVLAGIHPATASSQAALAASNFEELCHGRELATDSARTAIEFVARTVAEAHVDGPERDAAALQGLRALGEVIRGPVTPAALALGINRELARSRDAHLRVELPATVAERCHFLPFGLVWTDTGLLVSTHGGPVPAGSRISMIGGRSLDQLEALAQQVIPHENPYWARSEFARLAVREDWADGADLRDNARSVEVVYVTPAGAAHRSTVAYDHPSPPTRAWVGFQLYPAQSTGHFWMDRCDPDEEFFGTLDEFVVAVREAGIRKVAIDLRRNPGGDVGVALAVLRAFGAEVTRGFGVEVRVSDTLLAAMPMFAPTAIAPAFQSAGVSAPPADAARYQMPPSLVLNLVQARLGDRAYQTAPGRDLYLLTAGATFSSAALFTVLVRDNALGRIVGEPNGNSASFNGSEVILPVPGLPHELHLSTAQLSRPEPLSGNAMTVLPDVLAPSTPQSLTQRGDPALDVVRQAPLLTR